MHTVDAPTPKSKLHLHPCKQLFLVTYWGQACTLTHTSRLSGGRIFPAEACIDSGSGLWLSGQKMSESGTVLQVNDYLLKFPVWARDCSPIVVQVLTACAGPWL
jgi:hypothetical protein